MSRISVWLAGCRARPPWTLGKATEEGECRLGGEGRRHSELRFHQLGRVECSRHPEVQVWGQRRKGPEGRPAPTLNTNIYKVERRQGGGKRDRREC